MIVAADENGRPFPDETIMSNLLTMLIAGEDTTAFTLAWALHELCDSPDWRARLRREADEVLGASGVVDDLDAANRLASADAVASETMRLRPAAPFAGATANVDTTVGGYFIPKGQTVLLLLRPGASSPPTSPIPSRFVRNDGSEKFRARTTLRPICRSAPARACAPAARSRSSR